MAAAWCGTLWPRPAVEQTVAAAWCGAFAGGKVAKHDEGADGDQLRPGEFRHSWRDGFALPFIGPRIRSVMKRMLFDYDFVLAMHRAVCTSACTTLRDR